MNNETNNKEINKELFESPHKKPFLSIVIVQLFYGKIFFDFLYFLPHDIYIMEN